MQNFQCPEHPVPPSLQGLRSMQRTGPKLAVRKYDFDWHGMLKELREGSTVEALWVKLQGLLPESGLASGVMEPCGALAAETRPGEVLIPNSLFKE